jgi:RNA polymerase primary sigma factor
MAAKRKITADNVRRTSLNKRAVVKRKDIPMRSGSVVGTDSSYKNDMDLSVADTEKVEIEVQESSVATAQAVKEKTLKKTKKVRTRSSSDSESGDSILNWYLNEIHKIPMLTREEEQEVAGRASDGDERARNSLVKANLRFVVTVARKYQSYGLSMMDLINEGNMGLIKAAERFNPERGFHFISYAVWWIKQSILFAIQQKSHLIRLPLNRTADLRRMEEAERLMDNQDGVESSIQNLADVLEMKSEDLSHLINISRDHLSLDAPVQDGEDYTLGDNIEDSGSHNPDSSVENIELKKEILESLNDLTTMERKVLFMRFGLDGGPVLSLQKIGKTIGLSKERIRQIEKKAIRKIRTGKHNQQLVSYL